MIRKTIFDETHLVKLTVLATHNITKHIEVLLEAVQNIDLFAQLNAFF